MVSRIAELFFLIAVLFTTNADAVAPRGGAPVSATTVNFGLNIGGLAEGGSVIPGTPGVNFYVPTLTSMQYYHSKNLNFVRLPFLWERLQPTLGGALDPTYLGYIQQTVTYAASLGMTVLLDAHNFGGYCYGTVCGQVGGVGGPTVAQFANLWSQLATVFVGNTAVGGYDLMNEPNNMPSASSVPTMYQAAVTAIRLVDTATSIYLEGNGYASSYAWLNNCTNCGGWQNVPPGNGGNNNLLTVTDPNTNLVFSAHAYADSNGSGSYPTYPTASSCTPGNDSYQCAVALGDVLTTPTSAINTSILVKRYTPFINWCNTNNVKCHIGETGVPNDDQNWLTTLDNGLALLKINNIKFNYWNADGTNFTYPLNVDPQPSNGLDEPQMAVLTKYTNAYLPTSFIITGPQRGTASVPSSNFTLSYYGYIPVSQVYTLSDGGAGGTFTPSTLIFATGFNGSSTFTYTAPGTDVYAISATNNLAYTELSALGYATIADQFSMAGLTNSQINNVFSSCKIYAPYIGPAFNLRRSSDNVTKDFNFTSVHLGACVDQTAITTWLSGATAYVVTRYDQGPNKNNSTIPTADGTAIVAPITTADQPQLILNDQNSLADISWGSNRMEANSPLGGTTGQTILSVYNPTQANPFTSLTQQALMYFGWPISPSDTLGAFSSDIYANSTMAGSAQMQAYALGGGWNAIGATWGTSSEGELAGNGAILVRVPSGGHSFASPYRSYTTMGFQPFSAGRFAGKDGEEIVLSTNLTEAQLASFQSDQETRWGITPSSYSFVAPTLNQNPSAQNTLPWRGVAGTGVGEGFSQVPNASYNYWASRGANIYRFVVNWNTIQPNLCTGNTTLDPATLAIMDNVVAQNTAVGVETMFDLHNYGAYSYAGCASPPDDGKISSTTTQSYYVNYWTQIAAHYAASPKVIFDPMNEPVGVTDAQMMTATQAVINSVRGAGYNNYFLIEFGSGNSACGSVTGSFTGSVSSGVLNITATAHTVSVGQVIQGSGIPAGTYIVSFGTGTGLTGTYNLSNNFSVSSETINYGGGPAFTGIITDTSNRVALNCHAYLTTCGFDGCTPISNQGQGLATVTNATTYALANNVKLFWGEAGIAAFTPSQYAETKAALEYIAAHQNSGSGGWMGWVAWGAGTWGESYSFKQDQWYYTTPVVDRPTVRLLNTEFTGGTWPATQTFTNCYPGNASCTINFP